jgi:hypothetical protein
MKSIEYVTVSQTKTIFLKRLHTKLARVEFSNVGQENWFNSLLKSKKDHVVLTTGLEQSNPEFKFIYGPTMDTNNRRFIKLDKAKPATNSEEKRTAEPGDKVEFWVYLTPKKFATKGWHKIELFPTLLESPEFIATNRGRPYSTRVYVVPQYFFWFHLKRTLRLMFVKPGRVAGAFENKAFQAINSPELCGYMPVVMAMWQRLEHLPRTIEELEKQIGVRPILYIWNNNPEIRGDIEKSASLAGVPIKVFHSTYNIGGFGRFFLAKMLQDNFKQALFIDDDQILEYDTVQRFAQEFIPHTVKGYWAYNFTTIENYWRKNRAEPEKSAHYVGTGGMLLDLSIFHHPQTFKCPKRYWFVEDLWLCFVASHYLGWSVTRSKTDLEIISDGKDQLNKLIDLKSRMLKYLVDKKKWNIL